MEIAMAWLTLALSFLALLALPAHGAMLTLSDVDLTFTAPGIEFSMQVPDGALPLPVMVSDSDGSFSLPSGILTLPARTFIVPNNFPATSTLPGLNISNAVNQSGQFGPQNGGFGGAMPFSGTFSVVPLNLTIPSLPRFPLSIFGGGGAVVFDALVTSPPFPTQATATGATWTTARRTIPIAPGITAFTTGSNNLDPVAGGSLTLVSPVRVVLNDSLLGQIFFLPPFGVGRLKLTFVPEPGSLTLLATAALGTALVGRRRRG